MYFCDTDCCIACYVYHVLCLSYAMFIICYLYHTLPLSYVIFIIRYLYLLLPLSYVIFINCSLHHLLSLSFAINVTCYISRVLYHIYSTLQYSTSYYLNGGLFFIDVGGLWTLLLVVGVLGLLNNPWRYRGGWFKLGPEVDDLVGVVLAILDDA